MGRLNSPSRSAILRHRKHWFAAVVALGLVALTAVQATAQVVPAPSPVLLALGGAVHARTSIAELAIANPALVGDSLSAVAAACPGALASVDLTAIAAAISLPAIDRCRFGASLTGLTTGPYRRIEANVHVAYTVTRSMCAGVTLGVRTIAIDHYGSTFLPRVDVGVLAHLSPTVALGAALANLLGRTDDGDAPPRCLSLGTAADLGDRTIGSLDVMAAPGRIIATSLGLSTAIADGVAILGSLSSGPAAIALGATVRCPDHLDVDVAARWSSEVGIRESIAVRFDVPATITADP